MSMQMSDRQQFRFFYTVLLCLLLTACGGTAPWRTAREAPEAALIGTTQMATALEHRWIINATEATRLIDQGATVLDARGQGLFRQRLSGAVVVNWQQFSPREGVRRGTLLDDDDRLTHQLQALGISTDTPVVVFADPPHGWGEDGRIVWMLRTLGHSQAVMVDGGFRALVAAKVPLQRGQALAPPPGDFVVRRRATWSIQREQLRDQLESEQLVLLDTREPREFAGQTPYGEQRGGHLPGAIPFYFKDFLRENGHLKSRETLLAQLRQAGITANSQVVVYCTGGIRSGWVAAVLVTLGLPVKNYAGSTWEWSAGPSDRYPLTTL